MSWSARCHPLHEGVDWNIHEAGHLWLSELSPSTRGCGLKCFCLIGQASGHNVTLYTRVWIEITSSLSPDSSVPSHPLHEGVDWNILNCLHTFNTIMSPSTRGCGLKFRKFMVLQRASRVTLYTRVWIEIQYSLVSASPMKVTLYTRVWIEILWRSRAICKRLVTLYTRVWIEMFSR